MAGAGTALSGSQGPAADFKNREMCGAAPSVNVGGPARLVSLPPGNTAVGTPISGPALGRWCCLQLESGNIVFVPAIPFDFPVEWRTFLLKQRIAESRHHKNVAYRPVEGRLTGVSSQDKETQKGIHSMLQNYSACVVDYLSKLLPEYQRHWLVDYASFRPFEEQGRRLRLRARNDLLHTDAFPTRPTNGNRILALLHQSESRAAACLAYRSQLRDSGLPICLARGAPGLPPPASRSVPPGGAPSPPNCQSRWLAGHRALPLRRLHVAFPLFLEREPGVFSSPARKSFTNSLPVRAGWCSPIW